MTSSWPGGLLPRDIPAIFLSAPPDIEVFKKRGIERYFRKPFHLDELLSTVTTTISDGHD